MKKNSYYTFGMAVLTMFCIVQAGEVHEYAKKGDLAKVTSYINDGGELNARDNSFRTPLHYSSGFGQYEIFSYLIEQDGLEIDPLDASSRTPLHYACCIDDFYFQAFGLAIVTKLLARGAAVDAVDENIYTPLHLAVLSDQYDIVFTLLKNQADPSLCTDQGQTALHLAAIIGNKKIIELLCSYKARTDLRDGNGDSPRNLAIRHGNFDIVELLNFFT